MRNYEATIIFRGKEDDVAKGKSLVESELTRVQGKVLKTEDRGKRDLAYPIKKENQGHYFLYEIELDPAKISDIEKNFKLSSEILKYLFINKEQ